MLTRIAQALREQVNQHAAQPDSEIEGLKTHQNTVADTSPLPPEILSNIFIVLRRIVAGGDHYESDVSWTRVTHVCRYWRAAALDCSALWSDLIFINPALTEMMLQWSKNAPLTVHFAAHPVQYQDILSKIASQTGRLRDVELRSTSYPALNFPKILSSFESTAPILERLVLDGGYEEHHTLPKTFLRDGAPSLRHLEVLRFEIPSRWDALPLSSTLTYLRLQNYALATRPARKGFLESMGQLLQLETLKLISSLPQSGDVSHPSGRSLPLTLPSLRTLELQDSTAEVHQFFSATQIPKEAKINLALTDEAPVSESLGPLFSALKASWILSSQDMHVDTNGSRLSAQSDILDLRIVGHYESRIKCWFVDNKLPTKFDDDDPPANLAVLSKSSRGVISIPLLTTIADHLDISSLHSLQISSDDVFEEDALTLFKNLTKLDTITICGNYETLSKFLDEFQKQGSDTTSVSFPAMRSVHLHKIDFDELRTGEAGDAVRAFITALEKREASHPIEQLTISKCINFSKAHWKDLRASSISEDVEMDWDEDEDIRQYEDSDYDYDCDDYDRDYDYDYNSDSDYNHNYDYDDDDHFDID